MIIEYQTIGQRCTGENRLGKRCRLPAATIAGGLAVCPYHIRQAIELFRKVSRDPESKEFQDVFESAKRDSTIY